MSVLRVGDEIQHEQYGKGVIVSIGEFLKAKFPDEEFEKVISPDSKFIQVNKVKMRKRKPPTAGSIRKKRDNARTRVLDMLGIDPTNPWCTKDGILVRLDKYKPKPPVNGDPDQWRGNEIDTALTPDGELWWNNKIVVSGVGITRSGEEAQTIALRDYATDEQLADSIATRNEKLRENINRLENETAAKIERLKSLLTDK
jgi:hypothetical protein